MPSSFFFFFCRCFDIYVHTQSRVSGSCIPRHFSGVVIFPPLWTRATLLLAPSVTNYKLITISSTTALLSKSFTPPTTRSPLFPIHGRVVASYLLLLGLGPFSSLVWRTGRVVSITLATRATWKKPRESDARDSKTWGCALLMDTAAAVQQRENWESSNCSLIIECQ